jgi:hypothetical protein
MTWLWFVIGWFLLIGVVAPLLGRHFEELDDDWP